tara:strand:+ start:306 stop:1007 length:702 start_codon:yes stop_codon:yes gene_type:complete
MADTDVTGSIRFSDGTSVPLENLAMTESATGLASTAVELQTDATFTVSAQSIGTYAQNKTITHAQILVQTSGSNAYVDRQGLPIAFIPICRAGVSNLGLQPLCKPVRLMPGDRIMVCNQANATRTSTFVACCSDGTERAFVATPSGAATTSLVDTVTGNSIGNTLQGKTITRAMMSSVDGILLTSGGGLTIVNAQGAVVGVLPATNPTLAQSQWIPFNTNIQLNFDAQVVTSA